MTTAVTEIQRFRVNRNAWKTSLTKEIIDLEDNLDQLFLIVGLKPHRVMTTDDSEIDESTLVTNSKRLRDNEPAKKKQQSTSYESIIDEHFVDIQRAVSNICALITSVTEFDLPVPVHVLLRLASRLHLLKWPDYKRKMAGSLSRKYMYTKSLRLIQAGLKLFKWISIVLGSNTLPFQTYINQNILTILEWTKTSSLDQHDRASFFELRSQIFGNISLMTEFLSTNFALEPNQLKSLVEVEIIANLEEILWEDAIKSKIAANKIITNGTNKQQTSQQVASAIDQSTTSEIKTDSAFILELKDKYSVDALCCLERLFICYADFLEAPTEHRVKSFVIRTCLEVYRDFERNVISLAVRRQLIRMVETIANRPYATSTTELASHVLELAERMESDAEIKFIARRSIKVGLAHRPTIVSHYGVYSTYAGNLLALTNEDDCIATSDGAGDEDGQANTFVAQPVEDEAQQEQLSEPANSQSEEQEQRKKQEQMSRDIENHSVVRSPAKAGAKTNEIVIVEGERESEAEKDVRRQVATKDKKVSETEVEEKHEEQQEERPEDDPQVQSYLSLFVDKPAS